MKLNVNHLPHRKRK